MSRFLNEEYTELHFMYGICDGNSRRAKESCHLRDLHHKEPNRAVFVGVHQRLRDTASFLTEC